MSCVQNSKQEKTRKKITSQTHTHKFALIARNLGLLVDPIVLILATLNE